MEESEEHAGSVPGPVPKTCAGLMSTFLNNARTAATQQLMSSAFELFFVCVCHGHVG